MHALLLWWFYIYVLHVVSWDYKQMLDSLVLNHSYFECNVLDTSGKIKNIYFP